MGFTRTMTDSSEDAAEQADDEPEGIMARPDAVLPPDIESWEDRQAQWDFVAFRLSREEMLQILAAVVGFDDPGEQDRTRLTVDELAAVLVELDVIREWQRQQLVEEGRSGRSNPRGRGSQSASQPDREDGGRP